MRPVDLRLAVPAGAAWLVAVIGIGFPGALPAAAVAGWALVLAGLIVALIARRAAAASVTLALTACALVLASAALQLGDRVPPTLLEAEGRPLTALAEVTATVQPGQGSYEITVTEVEWAGGRVAGGIPTLAFGPRGDAAIAIGSIVRLEGSFEAAEPGDDRSILLFTDEPPQVIAPPGVLLGLGDAARRSFAEAATHLPGDGATLLTGLAIGDDSRVDDRLDDAMKASSLTHLTAVSGANCAIVIGLVMALGRLAGVPRPVRVGASMAVLVAFVVLVTPEPSVVRAAVMAGLALLALAAGRPVHGPPVLALAVIVLLALDPWMARSYGFILSVAATAGLLLLAGPLARVLARWLPSWLATVIAVPLAAQLACQPVLVLLDASIPLFGVPANMLAAPAAPIATVVGLIGCVLLMVVPPLGMVACWIAWLPAAWIAAVAHGTASLPLARVPWLPGWPGVAVAVLATVVVLLAALGAGRVRRASVVVVVVGLVAACGAAAGDRIAQLRDLPDDWQIALCDVGQGDAVVLRSADATALVDTGEDPEPLRACLDDLGVGRLDLLVLTHFDLDHVGGAEAVMGEVDRVLVGPVGERDDAGLVGRFVAGGAEVATASSGLHGSLGDHDWSVLWPPVNGAPEPGNDASVVLRMEPAGLCLQGCLSSLLLGDLGEEAQQRMSRAAAAGMAPVDVVKVSHHGSADQSAPLYRAASAAAGLIGVGADNGYGHPTADLLDMLAAAGTTPFRSDDDGLVLLSPGADGGVAVWTER